MINSGAHGKFLSRLDLDIRDRRVRGYRYKLIPVLSQHIPADAEMEALIRRVRAPYEAKLAERLAVSGSLLFRQGNFNGTFDEVVLDALLARRTWLADNLFNPDPYYRQGGDMVRVGGVSYAIDPAARMGERISDLRIGGKPLQADKRYRATGWASLMEVDGPPVFDVVAAHLRRVGTVTVDTRPRVRVRA